MFGQLEANYQLGEVLGRGGMGIVYAATQRSLNRQVVVKIPHPELAQDPYVAKRFRIEALAGAQLTHKNIARVIDFGGGDHKAPYIVMEYAPGTALDMLRVEAGMFPPAIAIDLTRQILAALDASHTARIVHADIKTANVLVEMLPDGGRHARLIDFGLARFIDEPSQHDVRVLSGTPDYLAPELIQGGIPSIASDIYAAGVVLYELLTGTTPFGGGSSADIMNRQVDDHVVPPSLRSPDQHIPAALEAAILQALEKEPSARFAKASDFSKALADVTIGGVRSSARVARGTEPRVGFSTEATTQSWALGHEPAPKVANARVSDYRRAITSAVARNDANGIVAAYLELARAMIDDGELAFAATEIETALAILRPSLATPLWRLQLCLAALYSGLGDAAGARQAASRAAEDAERASSRLGQERARDLLARLSRTRA